MVTGLVRKINDIKLREKMILSYLVFLLIPLLVVGLMVTAAFRNAALDDAMVQAAGNVERVKKRSAEVLATAIGLSNRLSYDNRLLDMVTRRYGSVLEVYRTYRDYQTFRLFEDFLPDIAGIKIYAENPTLIDNWEFIPLTDDVANSFWYRAAVARPDSVGWYWFDTLTRPGTSRLSLIRGIRFPATRDTGLLVIDINTDRLDASLRAESFDTILVDSNGVVVAATDDRLGGHFLDKPVLNRLLEKKLAGSFDVELDGMAAKVFVTELRTELAFNSLRMVSIFSVDRIVERANQISLAGLAVMVGIFLLALIFISFIYSILANRLLSLSRQIDQVSQGNFTSMLVVDGTDEIGIISSQFNGMVGNIAALLERIRQTEEQKSRLELSQNSIRFKMLASQINPHFLFNALESIRMKAHLRGEKDIARTVKSLGRLMRKNLEAGEQPIPLREEIESVRSYLEIEKFRLEDQYTYTIASEPEVGDLLVPPLIIEPLVENAVVHGVQDRHGGGQVTVRAWREGQVVRVEIRDDGLGMTDERLRTVLQGLNGKESHHIGLANVHQRLVLGYGPLYGLTVSSWGEGPDGQGGTCISFIIPGEA